MSDGQHHASSHRFIRLAPKLAEKVYRNSYVAHQTRQFLARQVRALRGDKSQNEFGVVLSKPQSVVSRLEDPNYGKWTLQTLFDVASSLDRAVIIRIVDYPTFLRFTANLTDAAACPEAYNQHAVDELIESEERETKSSALQAWSSQITEQREIKSIAAEIAAEPAVEKQRPAQIISLGERRKKMKDAEETRKSNPLPSSAVSRAV